VELDKEINNERKLMPLFRLNNNNKKGATKDVEIDARSDAAVSAETLSSPQTNREDISRE
jgi:hypothetical protein